MAKREETPPVRHSSQSLFSWLLPMLAAAGLLLALSWKLLGFWMAEYNGPESYYSYAYFIPGIVALMLWHRRDALRATPIQPGWAALGVLLPAVALLVFASNISAYAILSSAFLLTLTSGVWLTLGTRIMRVAAFPLAYLWVMAPLPGPLLNDATHSLQMFSTVCANHLLNVLTFPTQLQGNVIHMQTFSLFVDVPCSGFKLLLSFLTLSAAMAYLVDGAPIKRIVLFLLGLPLALIVNTVRITLIGIVGECLGAPAAHIFHDWSGIITLVLGFVAFFSAAKGLGCRTFAGWPIF